MRKIIREGIVNSYVAICPYCRCKFIYQQNDLFSTVSGYFNYVECPMDGCNRYIEVNKTPASEEDLKELDLNA